MATAAAATRGRPRARATRPFAAVASLSVARNRVMLAATATATASENVEPDDGASFAQCLHRFKKFRGEAAAPKPAAVAPAFAVGKNRKCCSTPASKKAVARTPRTASSSRRKETDSSSRKSSAPSAVVAAEAAYDAPLWDFSEELCKKKVRASLSAPYDGAEEKGHQEPRRGGDGEEKEASRKRTAARWGVMLEEAMAGLPEPGEGRVRYLVDTFERLLSLSAGDDPEARSRGASRRRRNKDAAKPDMASSSSPGRAEEIDMASYPSVASSSEASCVAGFPRRNSRRSSSRDDRQLRRCNSIGSSERSWRRKVTGVTSQHPFNLRTEQRGKVKEENFVQRMMKMLLEEERLRNPLAQGLPWTTDEPQNLAKPPTKEPTESFDVVLHSAVRAVGRAKFDHQVTERNTFLEKLELEKEKQQKLDEDIEIKQLRKEQVRRAHPMPDFSKPFVPKRSVKPQTVPREPRFQTRLMRHNSKT